VHISFSYAVIIDKNLSIDAVHAEIPSLFRDRRFDSVMRLPRMAIYFFLSFSSSVLALARFSRTPT